MSLQSTIKSVVDLDDPNMTPGVADIIRAATGDKVSGRQVVVCEHIRHDYGLNVTSAQVALDDGIEIHRFAAIKLEKSGSGCVTVKLQDPTGLTLEATLRVQWHAGDGSFTVVLPTLPVGDDDLDDHLDADLDAVILAGQVAKRIVASARRFIRDYDPHKPV